MGSKRDKERGKIISKNPLRKRFWNVSIAEEQIQIWRNQLAQVDPVKSNLTKINF
jgi:hypothetical protein